MNGLPKLIGIHGHARAGKDTAATFLTSTYKDHYIESFAGPLKDAASAAFGVYRAYFDELEYKEKLIEAWGTTPRKMVQFMGTEMFRQCVQQFLPEIGSNFWVRRMERRLTNSYIPDEEGEYLPEHTVVIPDVRFQNEYDWIIENGGITIHLTRPGADGNVGIAGHASEMLINLHTQERTYHIRNDGTISDLHKKLADVVMATKY